MKTWWFNFPWHVDDIAHLIDLLPTRQTHTQKHKPIAMHTHTACFRHSALDSVLYFSHHRHINNQEKYLLGTPMIRYIFSYPSLLAAAGISFFSLLRLRSAFFHFLLLLSPARSLSLSVLNENTTHAILCLYTRIAPRRSRMDTHSTSLHGCWTGLICITSHFLVFCFSNENKNRRKEKEKRKKKRKKIEKRRTAAIIR